MPILCEIFPGFAWLAPLAALAANMAVAAPDQTPPPNEMGGILFAGASGIGHWKSRMDDFREYKVIKETCGGAGMPDMVSNIDRFFPYKPAMIFMQLGGNDMAGGKRTPEQVFEDFKAFVVKTRAALPDTVIIYMGLVPTVRRWDQREAHKALNQLIKDYTATQKNMDYMDEWEPFLGSDGAPRPDLFIRDGQHNNEEGYKFRAALTRPFLEKWHAPGR
jgi:hypothetical protein